MKGQGRLLGFSVNRNSPMIPSGAGSAGSHQRSMQLSWDSFMWNYKGPQTSGDKSVPAVCADDRKRGGCSALTHLLGARSDLQQLHKCMYPADGSA